MPIAIDGAAVAWSDRDPLEGRPLVVLLHGYGRDERALAAIADALGPGIVTAALRGPRPSLAPRLGGYCWYHVDENIEPLDQQAAEAVVAVLAWLDAVIADRGTPSAIAVAGFSQGAALALHLLRTEPERFAATVTLGGYWLRAAAPADDRLAGLAPAVFWGRTDGDPAIGAAHIAWTAAALGGIAPGAEHVYRGDEHAIVPDELADVVAYLRERVAQVPESAEPPV